MSRKAPSIKLHLSCPFPYLFSLSFFGDSHLFSPIDRIGTKKRSGLFLRPERLLLSRVFRHYEIKSIFFSCFSPLDSVCEDSLVPPLEDKALCAAADKFTLSTCLGEGGGGVAPSDGGVFVDTSLGGFVDDGTGGGVLTGFKPSIIMISFHSLPS